MICLSDMELRAVFLEWETDAREGRTMPHAEAIALPIEQTVEANVDNFKRIAANHIKQVS